jgi:hypothetical protein
MGVEKVLMFRLARRMWDFLHRVASSMHVLGIGLEIGMLTVCFILKSNGEGGLVVRVLCVGVLIGLDAVGVRWTTIF